MPMGVGTKQQSLTTSPQLSWKPADNSCAYTYKKALALGVYVWLFVVWFLFFEMASKNYHFTYAGATFYLFTSLFSQQFIHPTNIKKNIRKACGKTQKAVYWKSFNLSKEQRSEVAIEMWRLVFSNNDFDLSYCCWIWVISQYDRHGECSSKYEVALSCKFTF